MTSKKKRIERLRWCMRYIMIHPDCSPKIYVKEWKVDSDFAIEIASRLFAEAFINCGCDEKCKYEELEEKIFNKILELT